VHREEIFKRIGKDASEATSEKGPDDSGLP
jgi:sRNA-binding carbon storage regulator CsrA